VLCQFKRKKPIKKEEKSLKIFNFTDFIGKLTKGYLSIHIKLEQPTNQYNTLMTADVALKLFSQGNNCAQSILVAFAEEAGIDAGMAFSMASGLGGGIGETQNICGAINAGAIVLGLKFGKHNPNDSNSKDWIAAHVGNFIKQCRQELGDSQCSGLLKFNFNDSEKKKEAEETGHTLKVCTNVVETTARILIRFLNQNPAYENTGK